MTRSDSSGRKGVKSKVGNQEYLSGIVNGKAVSNLAGDDEETQICHGEIPFRRGISLFACLSPIAVSATVGAPGRGVFLIDPLLATFGTYGLG